MNNIEDSVRLYKEKIIEQNRFEMEDQKLAKDKDRNENLQKQKKRDEKDRMLEDKIQKQRNKLIKYAELTNPSERIFNYFRNQLISGDLENLLLKDIQNTGETNNILLFADNRLSESFFKAVDFGNQGRYTDRLRYGLDLNTIFGIDFIMKSTKSYISTLRYPYQIDHHELEFNRIKSCLMYCLEKHGPYKYIVENGSFKGYVLYGEIQGSFLTSRYVYGIRKETYLEKFVKLFQ